MLLAIMRIPGRLVLAIARATVLGAFIVALTLGASLLTAFSTTAYSWITSIGTVLLSSADVASNRTKSLETELDRTRATKQIADADLEKARIEAAQKRVEIAKLNAENARLRADAKVVYRGKYRTVRDATQEYAELTARRMYRLAVTNIGSMAGEAIPYVGAAVVVSATLYEMSETCGMMTDMHEFTSAMKVDRQIDENIVCGLDVPSLDELVEKVKGSTEVILLELPGLLPTWDFPGGWADLSEKANSWWQ